MLRNDSNGMDRSWPGSRRLVAALVMIAVAIGAASFPGPTRGLARDEPVKSPVEVRAELPSFDMRFIPDGAIGAVAIRPAAAFRHSGTGKYATVLEALGTKGLTEWFGGKTIDTSQPDFPRIRLEDIEQMTAGVFTYRSKMRDAHGKELPDGKEQSRIVVHGLMVRLNRSIDWLEAFRARGLELTEVSMGDRKYYQFPEVPILGKAPSAYFPDDRTIVFDEETEIRALIQRGTSEAPAYTRTAEWDRVSRGLLAVVFDNADDNWTKYLDGERGPDDEVEVTGLYANTDYWFIGADDSDEIALRLIASCRGPEGTEVVVRAVEKYLGEARQEVEHPSHEVPDAEKLLADLLKSLVRNFHVAHEGRSVTLSSTGFGTLADFFASMRVMEFGP